MGKIILGVCAVAAAIGCTSPTAPAGGSGASTGTVAAGGSSGSATSRASGSSGLGSSGGSSSTTANGGGSSGGSTGAALCGSQTFANPATFPEGTLVGSVTTADINGDGFLDLAVTNALDPGTVSVMLGDGAGDFEPRVSYAVGYGPYAIATKDLDGNGLLDLVVANQGFLNGNGPAGTTVSVLLAAGDGGFSAQTKYPVGNNPDGLAIGDFNGDGLPDLAIANFTDGDISVLLGTGAGAFGAQTTFAAGAGARILIAVDFDGDGNLDLATANYTDGTVSVLLGTGTGSFGAQTTYAVGNNPKAVVAADFNGDGKLDLATANYGDGTVSLLLATGGGAFAAQKIKLVGNQPFAIRAADLNGDGNVDLVVPNYEDDTVSVLLGHGDGTFCVQQTFAVGPEPKDVAIGDFDDDGHPDLAVPAFGSNGVSVLLNRVNSTGPTLPNLAAMTDGGTTYMNGQPTFVTSYDGGVKTTVMLGKKNDPLFTLVWPDANHVNVTGDQNQDGTLDYQYQGSFDGTNFSETEFADHDFDGVFEAERTRTVVLDGGSYWLTETLYTLQGPDGGVLALDAGGSYVVTGSAYLENFDQQADGEDCEPTDTEACDVLPADDGGSIVTVGYDNIHLVENGQPGSCDPNALGGLAIDKVLKDALFQLMSCLGYGHGDFFNAKELARLMTTLGNLRPDTAYVLGCGLTCKDVLGATRVFASWPLPGPGCATRQVTNFNPLLLQNGGFKMGDGTNAGQLQEVFTHELLHFAGDLHNPQKYGAPNGKDRPYACGRYCNLCQADVTGGVVEQAVPVNSPQSFHDDCYICADDVLAHKAECGSQYINFKPSPGTALTCTSFAIPNPQPFACSSAESYDVAGCALNNPVVLTSLDCCDDASSLSCCDSTGACNDLGCADVQDGGLAPLQECDQYGTFLCTSGVLN